MRIDAIQAVLLLRAGKVVAVPTETVYGLAGDALNPHAIATIFEIKKRPADNPLICHFNSSEHVKGFVREISPLTAALMQHFSPGPISFMVDLHKNSPLQFATCGSQQAIVRIPANEIFLEIISQLDHPVAAPSANTSGRVSPTSAEMVEHDLGIKVEAIVDGGNSKVGLESTIVDARGSEIFILRPGSIGIAEIQAVMPHTNVLENNFYSEPTPGSRYRHYSPRTPVYLINHFSEINPYEHAAILLTKEQLNKLSPADQQELHISKIRIIILGSLKKMNKLAQSFYQHLAALDEMNISKAYLLNIEWGTSSLGKALKNRIEKIAMQS